MDSHIPFLFMDYSNEFKNLLPDELEIIRSILDDLMATVKNSKITNVKYQDKNKTLKCPNCKLDNYVVKNGTKNDIQYYKCKNCNKFFSISTDTLTSGIMLNYNQLVDFMLCLINYSTLLETANIIGLSERTTYNIRIKIISTLNKYKT